jgi:hypothetical protein
MMKRTTTLPGLFALTVALATTIGCPNGAGSGEGEGEGTGEGEEEPINSTCPAAATGITVCDVQSTGSPKHPVADDAIQLVDVVAISQSFVVTRDMDAPSLFGVFVADDPMAEFGGVFVTWQPGANAPASIAVGNVLRIEGTAQEFKLSMGAPDPETRVAATVIAVTGQATPLTPIAADAPEFASAAGEGYEGTLVIFNDVSVTALNDFGRFTLSNGVVVTPKMFSYDARVGDQLTSIVGVVSYNIFSPGGFELLPRTTADVVVGTRATVETVSVTALNDGTIERCAFDNFADCKTAVTGVVVASTFFVSSAPMNNPTQGAKFGFYLADPDNVDADGRLQAKSGIFVTVTPQNVDFPVDTAFTFEQDAQRKFLPGAAPEIGDIVTVVGQNSSNFDNSEFRFTKSIEKTGTATAPLPALFDGALPANDPRHPSKLKGGRPDVDGDFGVAQGFDPPLEGVAAAAGLEDWEGVFVELANVETTTACYAGANMGIARDFGTFLVTGDVEIGTQFRLDQSFGGFFPMSIANNADKECGDPKCEDSREVGQSFTSLKGIVSYSFNVHRVSPRIDSDISAAFVAPDTGTCQ